MSLKFWFMQSPNVVNLRQYKKTFFKTTDYASVPRQPDVGRKINRYSCVECKGLNVPRLRGVDA